MVETAGTERGGAMRKAAAAAIWLMTVLPVPIGISVFFSTEEPVFPREANVLIATFATGMGVLGVTLVWRMLYRHDRGAWTVLWAYPAFFVTHVIGFQTFAPDGILAVLYSVALFALRPTAEKVAAAPVATTAVAKVRSRRVG